MYLCLPKTGKWLTNNSEILKLTNNKWQTYDISILSLAYINGTTVAHYLAMYSKVCRTKDSNILNLTSSYGVTVNPLLKKRIF